MESALAPHRRAGRTLQHDRFLDSVRKGTKMERENRKDPRLSIEERYENKRVYLEKITQAALTLEKQGLLLDQDVPKLRERAGREWDFVESLP